MISSGSRVVKCIGSISVTDLSIEGYTITTDFNSMTTEYTVVGIGRFTITPTAADETAVIRVQGIIVTSGEATVEYEYGPHQQGYDYTIEVTAQDGITTTTYSINAQQPPN